MLRAILPPVLALCVACAAAPPGAEPAPGAPVVTAEPAARDASVEATAEAAPVELDAGGGSDALLDADADAAPQAPAADGMPCARASDCQSGICEGAGCEYESGECASKARSCSAKLAWYCSCDGTDFQASVDCPGRRFAYPSRCGSARAWGPGAAPDGAPCLRASQCKSGVCEGLGCDDAHPGTCQPPMRGCGQSAVQYCGCDGRSFSSNPCPGVRYAATGPCPIDPNLTSVIKVLSVTGKSAKLNDELKSLLVASERLRRCHAASGEKSVTATLDLEADGKGHVRVKKLVGLTGPGTILPRCIEAFARSTVIAAAAGASGNVSVKLRFELTRSKP